MTSVRFSNIGALQSMCFQNVHFFSNFHFSAIFQVVVVFFFRAWKLLIFLSTKLLFRMMYGCETQTLRKRHSRIGNLEQSKARGRLVWKAGKTGNVRQFRCLWFCVSRKTNTLMASKKHKQKSLVGRLFWFLTLPQAFFTSNQFARYALKRKECQLSLHLSLFCWMGMVSHQRNVFIHMSLRMLYWGKREGASVSQWGVFSRKMSHAWNCWQEQSSETKKQPPYFQTVQVQITFRNTSCYLSPHVIFLTAILIFLNQHEDWLI